MTAPVRIDACAWGDIRFVTLARLCGLAGGEHALIMCAKIWSWQTEHYTPDAPTYAIDIDLIESVLGTGGAVHMVRARLAEETPDGFRIKGSTGRIEWLWKKRLAAKAGGDATKRKHENRTGPHGQPNGQAVGQPQGSPAVSPLVPDLVPVQIPEALPLRAIGSAHDFYDAVSAARVEIAAELKLAKVLPLPARFGMPSEPRGCRELRDRFREEGDLASAVSEHVLANLIAQAREERSVEWLSEKAFTAGGWQTARNWVPGQQRQRAGPKKRDGALIGPAAPSLDYPDERTSTPIGDIR